MDDDNGRRNTSDDNSSYGLWPGVLIIHLNKTLFMPHPCQNLLNACRRFNMCLSILFHIPSQCYHLYFNNWIPLPAWHPVLSYHVILHLLLISQGSVAKIQGYWIPCLYNTVLILMDTIGLQLSMCSYYVLYFKVSDKGPV